MPSSALRSDVPKTPKITVQIAVESALGQLEVIQQVALLERWPSLQPTTLGLSLAEARSILAGLEQTIVERQCAEWVALEQRCPRCGRLRAYKGHHAIVLRTPFGKLNREGWPHDQLPLGVVCQRLQMALSVARAKTLSRPSP